MGAVLSLNFKGILAITLIGMIAIPAHAEWDPSFETPHEFNRREYQQQQLLERERATEAKEKARARAASRKQRPARNAEPMNEEMAPVSSAPPSKLQHSARRSQETSIDEAPPVLPSKNSKPKKSTKARISAPSAIAEETPTREPAPVEKPQRPTPKQVSAPKTVTAPKQVASPKQVSAPAETEESIPQRVPVPSKSRASASEEVETEEAPVVQKPMAVPSSKKVADLSQAPAASSETKTPEFCATTPKTGADGAATMGRELARTVAMNGKKSPTYVFDPNDEEVEIYKKPGEALPKKPTASNGQLSPLVQRLLSAARQQVTRNHRGPGTKAASRPQMRCLQGVRLVLQKATGEGRKISVMSAKNAGPGVMAHGFTKDTSGKYNEYNAPIGSVLIYKATNNPSAHGHIEIRGEDGYYSDFVSKGPISARAKTRVLIGVYVPPAA